MSLEESLIKNVDDLIAITISEGDVSDAKYPHREGYTIRRQSEERWHFILTSNPSLSLIKVLDAIRSYQFYAFNIIGQMKSLDDLNAFVSRMTPDTNKEVSTHIHGSNPTTLLVMRIFHDQYIPNETV